MAACPCSFHGVPVAYATKWQSPQGAGGWDETTPLGRNQLQATQTACLHLAARRPDAFSGGTRENAATPTRCPGVPCPGSLVSGLPGFGCIIPVYFRDALLGGVCVEDNFIAVSILVVVQIPELIHHHILLESCSIHFLFFQIHHASSSQFG